MRRADQRKFHYIYKIIRFDRKYYIGMHSTDNLDDGYFGSGTRIKRSIKKYGKEKHQKEIVEFLETRGLLKLREAVLVNIELLQDPLCMNLVTGGDRSFKLSNGTKEKIKLSSIGRRLSNETRKKIGNTLRGRARNPEASAKTAVKNKGKKRTPEQCKRFSESLIGRKRNPNSIAKMAESQRGKKLSEEHKAKLKIARAKQKRNPHTIEYKQKMSEQFSKPCTIDGITIYSSKQELSKALGHGKNGTRSASFKYVSKT